MKVLVMDKVAKAAVELLRENGLEVEEAEGLGEEEMMGKIKGFDALIVRSATKVTKNVIGAADSLKVIGRAGAGVDNIDVSSASAKGIKVLNTPGANTISVAEHTLAMVLSLCRRTPKAHASLRDGKWEKHLFKGRELYCKTIGVIGAGKIGREVIKRLKAFDVNILVADPFLDEAGAKELGVKKVGMDELLKDSFLITIHVPMTDKTRNLLDEKEFNEMKDGVKIINIARGGIVNEKALLNALNSGKVAGAAIDTFENEPNPMPELLKHDNVVVTPHLGAATVEAQDRAGLQVAGQIVKALQQNEFINAVN
ncbi:MAG: hydroxyacid dehydrogenase [Candidatus Diapherotrites archaeon]